MAADYLAHVEEETGREQRLRDHLTGVAELSGGFAAAFGEEAAGRALGMYHDIGKYSRAFQDYLRADEVEKKKRRGRIDHSTAGAQEFWKLRSGAGETRPMRQLRQTMALMMASCVAGHHGGIPNMGTNVDGDGEGTLAARLKKSELPDYSTYQGEVPAPVLPMSDLARQVGASPLPSMVYTRMLFSCLVDADFLDTERFMAGGDVGREGFPSMGTLLERLTKSLQAKFAAPKTQEARQKLDTPINRKRGELLRESIAAGKAAAGNLYRMTVPTGGGKTISSLAFALHYAVHAKKTRRRIIYVIPYTSIIEQNAAVFRELLGADSVVEHHQNVAYDDTADSDMNRRRLATENWDAPLIVTTSVQFFESLFSNRPSKCRKLHNLAESIVIFDEAQMLPLNYLRPSMAAIEELVRRYDCTAVLCTATQPPLEQFFSADMRPIEICPAVMENAALFRRTHIELCGEPMTEEAIARELASYEQVLCIVNVKKTAQRLFDLLAEEDGVYHLSTNLYPVHREKVLEEIRKRLREGKTCRVISTSLVEAGVDLDFPAVYREIHGLDSIVQAAGRCNREGLIKTGGTVKVFSLEKITSSAQRPAGLTKIVARKYGADLTSPVAITRYFRELYDTSGDAWLDKKGIMKKTAEYAFSDIAKDFRIIEDRTRSIFIPETEDACALLGRLERGERSRALLRQAGRYMVQVYHGTASSPFALLSAQGKLRMIDGELAVLTDLSAYDANKGLLSNVGEGEGLFC